MFLELVENDGLDDVVRHRVTRQIQMLVSQSLEDREHLSTAASIEKTILDLGEGDDPGVALHGRLFALQRQTLFGVEIKSLHFDLSHYIGMRPGNVGQRPVGSRSWPDTSALEGWRDLDDVAFTDSKLDLAGVAHHLQDVSVRRLVAGLCDQRLESRTDLPSR